MGIYELNNATSPLIFQASIRDVMSRIDDLVRSVSAPPVSPVPERRQRQQQPETKEEEEPKEETDEQTPTKLLDVDVERH